MSEQADAINKTLRERGVLEGNGSNGAPPSNGEPAADGKPPELPKARLPGDGHLLRAFAKDVGAVLARNGVFRRESIPVTIEHETGRIEEMEAYRFRSYVEKHLICFKYKFIASEQNMKEIPATMPVETARGCLAADVFRYQQRPLERVNTVRLPILRKDGRIELLPEGYDQESHTYTQPSGIVYDETMDLEAARLLLDDLLKEFPFGDIKADTPENREAGVVGQSRSKAVAVAAMLSLFGSGLQSPTARRLNFVYTANAPRSGKTLLVELAIIPTCGRANIQSMPDSREEFRKILDTEALSASPYVFLDDLDGFLRNNMLNAFMTANYWTGRLMNSQKKFSVPKMATVFLTGNNLELSNDIAGRSLIVELYVGEADAQSRPIQRLINDEYLGRPEIRKGILSALWSVVRAWDKAGRPRSARELRGYEHWSHIFGGIVQHAGFGDPLEAPQSESVGDTEFADMLTLVTALASEVSDRAEYEFSDIVECCRQFNCFEWLMEGKEHTDKETKETWFELSTKSRSMFGKILSGKFGGRIFVLNDGRRVRFGQRGKNRHRRYTVEVVLTL